MFLAIGAEPISRRRLAILFLALFASYAYFYQAGGWNQNATFDLVRALVEDRDVFIDRFASNTGDTSRFGDRVLSNKAPGTAFVAAPAVAVTRVAMSLAGVDPVSRSALVALSYVATLAAAAIPAAIAGCLVFVIARRLGADDGGGLVVSLLFGLATPQWAYGTLLFAHALSGACLIGALAAVLLMQRDHARRASRLAFVAGLLSGWAMITEYTTAPAAAVIGVFGLYQMRQLGIGPVARHASVMLAGAALPLGILLAYNWRAFGSPFQLSYSTVERFDLQKTGLFGVGLPSVRVLYDLLLGPWKGLLRLSPALAFAPFGLLGWMRARDTQPLALLVAAVVALFLVINAGFAYWWGGWNYGPRYLVPSLGFWTLTLLPLWQRPSRAMRIVLCGLLVTGVTVSLMAVSTTPQPPDSYQQPMTQLFWPLFRDGIFAANWGSIFDIEPGVLTDHLASGRPPAAWNLGQLAGLHRHMSLLPLATVWFLAAFLWRRAGRSWAS